MRIPKLTSFLGLWLSPGLALVLPAAVAAIDVPLVTTSNYNVRVMAANLTGNSQTYEPFALRIFQGLKPDVVAIQEFNYLNNTAASFRQMLDSAFGTNFSYFRESGYSIPNGIISRWPIRRAGSWIDSDAGVNDRGFAWAEIDLPGPDDLVVVSVHLKASSGTENELRRGAQAAELKALIQASFPAFPQIIVAGDCNIFSPSEPAMNTFRSFLTDDPVPTDAISSGNPNTNLGRNRRYDYVFPSPSLNARHAATLVGATAFPNGLVFDSRAYATNFNLADVVPVQAGDSGLAQHMAVVKDFHLSFSVTNTVTVTAPLVRWVESQVLGWEGVAGLTYTVESGDLPGPWETAGSAQSVTGQFRFTNSLSSTTSRFFRVRYP